MAHGPASFFPQLGVYRSSVEASWLSSTHMRKLPLFLTDHSPQGRMANMICFPIRATDHLWTLALTSQHQRKLRVLCHDPCTRLREGTGHQYCLPRNRDGARGAVS